jgi:hypothetical protein
VARQVQRTPDDRCLVGGSSPDQIIDPPAQWCNRRLGFSTANNIHGLLGALPARCADPSWKVMVVDGMTGISKIPWNLQSQSLDFHRRMVSATSHGSRANTSAVERGQRHDSPFDAQLVVSLDGSRRDDRQNACPRSPSIYCSASSKAHYVVKAK